MKSRACLLASCAILALSAMKSQASGEVALIISIPEQKLAVVQGNTRIAEYPISTSRYGVGDRPRSFTTPLGLLEVANKTGAGAREGAVFRSKQLTGEVLAPNAPGRDPIVTRILHLRGLTFANSRAYERGIYIHGTTEESKIGKPASFGCIRMKSKDVVHLFDETQVGTKIDIVNTSIKQAIADGDLPREIERERIVASANGWLARK